MPLVDPGDDSLTRYVVWHDRYDAHRRERRNVVVAAYDNETEFETQCRLLLSELDERKLEGEAEPVETISGTFKRPGSDAEQRQRRIEWRRLRMRKARVRRRNRKM